jgi:hypothetical protein
MNIPSNATRIVRPALVFFVLSACNFSNGEQLTAEQIASTMVAETAAAEQLAQSEAEVPAAPPTRARPTAAQATKPPEEPPTEVPTPGPLVVRDDFSSDTGIWDCEVCTLENGQLHFGPFPISGAYVQHFAYCDACGIVTNYRMSADIIFGEGQTDRGYGFLVREAPDYLFTYEITPWQSLDFWMLDFDSGNWDWVNGLFASAVKTGNQINRVEVEASASPSGGTDFALRANGKTPLVIFNRPADAGWVGFTMYGHAVEIILDNFVFETDETPLFPESSDSADA